MATAGVNPRIYSVSPVATDSSISFEIDVICDVDAYKLEFFLYNQDGVMIQNVNASWRANVHGKIGPFVTDTISGFAPFTIFTYKVVYSMRDTGQTIDTESGKAATKIPEFEWDTKKVKGGDLYITANEWNRLLDTCALEINYVGNGSLIPEYVIGASESENPTIISAQVYNYVIDIFTSRLGYKSKLEYVESGKTPISAALINTLSTAINQIIRRYDYGERPAPVEID